MKSFTNQNRRSYTDLVSTNAVKSRRLSLLCLILFTLLFMPTSMVAQTEYDNTVTFKALAGSPEGFDNETYANLFDGKKTSGNFSKWCCGFNGSAYVVFEASKAGIPVGYTITTGNDNSNCGGRNPKSWKLYGNNEGKDGVWTLIQEVKDDKVLQDVNYTSYDFTCEGSTSYKYFKWEISAIHSGNILQVGEFELKLKICSHTNADGSSALGKAIETFEATCIEHGYTTHKCSICHSTVKVYKDDELKAHTLTHHEAKAATCTEAGKNEYWQCSECNKLFSDEAATKEITDAVSLEIPAKGHQYDNQGTCTVCGATDFRYALFNNLDGITGVTITDNGSYPWQMLDLNAEGMTNLGFSIPNGSTGLMSSNYNKNSSTSETVVNFKVEKPILLTFKNLISSESWDKATFTIDNKELETISGIRQIEFKALLFVGEHSLKLSYKKDESKYKNADRTFIYDLKTATTISDYIAEYNAENTTLTFRKVNNANISDIGNNSVIVEKYNNVGEICKALGNVTIKNIVFEESFKTYAPTSLKEFFYNCTSLETISGLEYLNTANITDMSSMFQNCYNLKSLDFTNFDTKNVSNMYFMFNGCSTLTSLDLTNFNTMNVSNMYGMFCDCKNLTSLDITNFNTAEVTDMSFMFLGCSNLTSLDLTNFNTAKVTDMHGMFKACSALTSLDLTNFNTAEVRNMSYMFNMLNESSTALTTIYVSDNFVTTNVQYGDKMFKNCTKLKGFQKYFLLDIDHKYANYKTGYFTKLVGKNGDEKIGAVGETLTAENFTLADDKDFVAYEPFTAKAASYSRKMNAGTTWATLCLPFDVSLAEKNFRAFKLLSADEATNTVELEEITTSIAAGTPVIIKMKEGQTALDISEADKDIAQKVVSAADGNYQLQGLYTQKVFDKVADNNCYIVKGNKLMNPAKLLENTNVKNVTSKPFRAYMVDNTSAPAAGAKMFSIGFDDNSTTAIDNLNTIADDNAIYYDLQGKRLNAPQKGINIVKRGGKTMKVIIK